jgi:hypothetical protein
VSLADRTESTIDRIGLPLVQQAKTDAIMTTTEMRVQGSSANPLENQDCSSHRNLGEKGSRK